MIPTEYRLEQVVARLIERLDGARRSYDNPDLMRAEFERIADEHVRGALGEFREVGMVDEPQHHEEFLANEVSETFLPRYLKLAEEMNFAERRGFGMGALAKPLGRIGLVVATLMLVWFLELRFIRLPVIWPVMFVTLSLPFWPDIAGWLHRRRYLASLQSVLADMSWIQEQAGAYVRPERLGVADEDAIPAARRRRPGANREGS